MALTKPFSRMASICFHVSLIDHSVSCGRAAHRASTRAAGSCSRRARRTLSRLPSPSFGNIGSLPFGLSGTGQWMRSASAGGRRSASGRASALTSCRRRRTKVKVVDAEVAERRLDGAFDVAVRGAPQLRREEDVLARNARRLEPLADLALVLVHEGAVDVSVAVLERDLNGVLDLAGLALPGSCERASETTRIGSAHACSGWLVHGVVETLDPCEGYLERYQGPREPAEQLERAERTTHRGRRPGCCRRARACRSGRRCSEQAWSSSRRAVEQEGERERARRLFADRPSQKRGRRAAARPGG